MNLEDHAGDVLRKARLGIGMELKDLTTRTSIPEVKLAQFEESGSLDGLNLEAACREVRIDWKKLQGIANGWNPRPVDLATWREIRVISTSGSNMSVNSFLVWDEVSRDAAIFDTGFDATPILDLIAENQLQPRHLFLTHSHEDHIGQMGAIREKFPKIHLHSNSKTAPPQHRNRANDFTHLGSLRITNRETAGHAEDGVTYIIGNWGEDAAHVAIVGDAIFAGSMGGAKGILDQARQRIREQIFTLPDDTVLCPGHGPLTTLGEEKAANPFF